MKKYGKNVWIKITLLILAGILVGCNDNAEEEPTIDSSEESSNEALTEEPKSEIDETNSISEIKGSNENGTTVEETENEDPASESSQSSNSETAAPLSEYSSQEIEYARVWLQLGANQDIDGLYVQHIPAGTPLNPDDETSLSYPEDVIQLAGSRLVDGSVTYNGNGDGTINVYNVPLRWDGQYPAGKEFYTDIIDNTELVSIEPTSGQEVIDLIKLINEN